MMYDDWLWNISKITADSKEIWGAPYSGELINVIQNNGDIEEFIQQKDQDFHNRYMEEETAKGQAKIGRLNL